MQTLEFNIKLPANNYMNWNSVHICLPIQIRNSTTEAADKDAAMITVNKLLAHWIKEITIKRYGDNLQILPTTNTTEIYRYSGSMLKHMPKDALKT